MPLCCDPCALAPCNKSCSRQNRQRHLSNGMSFSCCLVSSMLLWWNQQRILFFPWKTQVEKRSQRELMAAHYRSVGHCQSVDALMPISSDFCWATRNWFACHHIRLFCRWPRNVPAALVRAWLLRGIPWIARKLSLFDLQVKSIVYIEMMPCWGHNIR